MNEIDRHKVFISFKYTEHHEWKDYLVGLNDKFNIFDDYSVGEGEIDDAKITEDEEIRIKIRDEWIRDASVLLLLNGSNMRNSKFIDWELHAAMYDGEKNKKMGILVINLPDGNGGLVNSKTGLVDKIMRENGKIINWIPFKDYETEIATRLHWPKRLIRNIVKSGVHIDVINWDDLKYFGESDMANRLKLLIDEAFKNRLTNTYDTSDKLQGRN